MSNLNSSMKPEHAIFNFACTSSSVLESGKEIELVVVRTGNTDITANVSWVNSFLTPGHSNVTTGVNEGNSKNRGF